MIEFNLNNNESKNASLKSFANTAFSIGLLVSVSTNNIYSVNLNSALYNNNHIVYKTINADTELKDNKTEQITIESKYLNSLSKLNTILCLRNNWNNNGAKAFRNEFIERVRNVIMELEVQPEIFPTANNSIELVYTKKDDSYLSYEIFDNKRQCEIFVTNPQGKYYKNDFFVDSSKMNKYTNSFYGPVL